MSQPPDYMKGIRVVAFDLDGTLIDTVPDLAAAANMMLLILGGTPLPEPRIAALVGGGVDRLVARVLRESRGSAPTAALQATAAALFKDLYGQRLFERSRLYPGVRETLQTLDSAGIALCCVTNKAGEFARPLLKATDIYECFASTHCADRAEDLKPSPNLLLAACAQTGIVPAQLLYVGDSASDIVAARAAGCRVVAVSYGYHDGASLAGMRPDRIVGNLTEIVGLRPDGPTLMRQTLNARERWISTINRRRTLGRVLRAT